MNETLIKFLQQNKTEKAEGGWRGKKIISGTVVNEEIPQGGVAARSITAMQQFGRIID